MSGFISNMMENFIESKTGSNQEYYQTESETYNTSNQGPPQVPYPWRAHWDDREQCYIYIHEETGEQVWEYDEVIRRTSGYQQQSGGGYYQQNEGYGGERVYESEPYEERSSGGGHGMAYGALGAAAGLAGGAALMYEGEKIHTDYEEDKYRVENDVEQFPENAAQWTGEKVGEVEAIPQDIEYGVDRFDNRVEQGFHNAVYDVENAPENVAGWVGGKVGDVERFDDNVDQAYDQGRYEGRYDNPGW